MAGTLWEPLESEPECQTGGAQRADRRLRIALCWPCDPADSAALFSRCCLSCARCRFRSSAEFPLWPTAASLTMALIDIFPEPNEMGLSALFIMMFFYGCVLMKASQVIGDGSELLMLLYVSHKRRRQSALLLFDPSLTLSCAVCSRDSQGPGIVGGVVIPLLGAVPDCAVILISGMGEGTKEEIQNQLAVGVGTLVGSTVMLLTIPWGLGVYLGRRDYDEVNDCASQATGKSKSTKSGLFDSCVTVMSDIPNTAKVMLASLTTYMIIQIPSLMHAHDKDGGVAGERPWALFCMIFSGAGFCLYCWLQVQSAESAERDRRLQEYERQKAWKQSLDRKFSEREHQQTVFKLYGEWRNNTMQHRLVASGCSPFCSFLAVLSLPRQGQFRLHRGRGAECGPGAPRPEVQPQGCQRAHGDDRCRTPTRWRCRKGGRKDLAA
jgi:Ca2+/Na+ antiporter